jgi:hypothetical protein
MATSSAGAALTAQHRQAQLQVRAMALRDFTRLWPLWVPEEASSFERLVVAALPLVRTHHQLSSSIATAYYQAFRRAEGASGDATPRSADPVSEDRVTTSLYVTGRVATGKAIAAGAGPEAAKQAALTRTSGAIGRHVLTGGREALIRSTSVDRQARGWARVTDGKPCAFCAMLAGRGAVYSDDSADFRSHDHCGCSVQPMYDGAELPGQRFREHYLRATREAREAGELERGTSNDLLNAFRRSLADD